MLFGFANAAKSLQKRDDIRETQMQIVRHINFALYTINFHFHLCWTQTEKLITNYIATLNIVTKSNFI